MKKIFKKTRLVVLSLVFVLALGCGVIINSIDPPNPIIMGAKALHIAVIDPPNPIAPPTEELASIDPPNPIAPPSQPLASIDPPNPIIPRG